MQRICTYAAKVLQPYLQLANIVSNILMNFAVICFTVAKICLT